MESRSTVNKKLKIFFIERDIPLKEAAAKIGYHYKHLSHLLNRTDLSNDQRERIILAYPETRSFLIPDWARVDSEEEQA